MKFGVLGSLAVWTPAGEKVTLRSRHQRTLMAVTLFRANQPVPVDQLVEALWAGAPPASYLSNLHTYVSRLRELVGQDRLDHLDGCYVLRVEPDELDLLVFSREAAAGREAMTAHDPARAVGHFRRALAQWRGPHPLPELSLPLLEPDLARLDADRLAVTEERIDAELAVGEHRGLLGELGELIAAHPLRERFRAQLMIALARGGRQADALAAYRKARAALVDELGVEPGPELRRVHEAILRGEDPGGADGAPPAAFPVRQLPPDLPDFTGRTGEIAEVTGLLTAGPDGAPVVVVSGNPGAGKSALAVRVAARLRADFPDGALFVHLAGASPEPRQPADVLGELLAGFGVSPAAIPGDLQARAAMYRAQLAGRRVLVLLDDAAGPAQVRPLLPGSAGSATLVTSRRRLTGLAGARNVPLGPLAPDDARALMRRLVGDERMDRAPEQAGRIIEACGSLALAVRIAGSRLATRPHLPLDHLADRLADERRRLDELAVDDLQVRASLELSYESLSSPARRAFRLLGLLGPIGVAAWTVAVLLDQPDADPVVEEMVEAGLLEPWCQDETGEPRYRLHDLLRVYAGERARAEEDDPDLLAVPRRLLAAALDLAGQAAERVPRTLAMSDLDGEPEELPAVKVRWPNGDALARLTAERAVVTATVHLACDTGQYREAAYLAGRLRGFLWPHDHGPALEEIHRAVLAAACRAGDEHAAATAEHCLGVLLAATGRYREAAPICTRTVSAFERLGDSYALGCALVDLATCLMDQGAVAAEAVAHATRGAEIFRDRRQPFAEANAKRVAAEALARLGRMAESLATSSDALALARAAGEPRLVALVLNSMVTALAATGELAAARTAAEEALRVVRGLGDRTGTAIVLRQLGIIYARLGLRREARAVFEERHELSVAMRERRISVVTERDLAAIALGDGGADAAVTVLERCLEAFREMGTVRQQAATLQLLARAYELLGSTGPAVESRREAGRLAGAADPTVSSAVAGLLVLAGLPADG